MRKPTIHLNGSAPTTLRKLYSVALVEIQVAFAALAECAPHGRDYYKQEPTPGFAGDAASEAMTEHRARLEALTKIENELLVILMDIDEQTKPAKE